MENSQKKTLEILDLTKCGKNKKASKSGKKLNPANSSVVGMNSASLLPQLIQSGRNGNQTGTHRQGLSIAKSMPFRIKKVVFPPASEEKKAPSSSYPTPGPYHSNTDSVKPSDLQAEVAASYATASRAEEAAKETAGCSSSASDCLATSEYSEKRGINNSITTASVT